MQEHYTSGQAAKACGVCARTVIGWMDSGLLKGWRLPGSEDRRFLKSEVARFCQAHKIPFISTDVQTPTLLADCEQYLRLIVPQDTVGKELLRRFDERQVKAA